MDATTFTTLLKCIVSLADRVTYSAPSRGEVRDSSDPREKLYHSLCDDYRHAVIRLFVEAVGRNPTQLEEYFLSIGPHPDLDHPGVDQDPVVDQDSGQTQSNQSQNETQS